MPRDRCRPKGLQDIPVSINNNVAALRRRKTNGAMHKICKPAGRVQDLAAVIADDIIARRADNQRITLLQANLETAEHLVIQILCPVIPAAGGDIPVLELLRGHINDIIRVPGVHIIRPDPCGTGRARCQHAGLEQLAGHLFELLLLNRL